MTAGLLVAKDADGQDMMTHKAKMRTWRANVPTGLLSGLVALLTFVSAARAQDGATVAAPQVAAPAEKDVFFPALDEYEKRGKVLLVREKMLFEISARDERVKKLDGIAMAFQSIRRLTDGDQQLIEYIQLRRRVLEALDEISDANTRQVELAALVDTAMTAGGLLPQVSTYLQDVRRQLLDLGVQQQNAEKRLKTSLQTIKTAIQNIPPPAAFISKTGLEMRLVGSGRQTFYVSSRLIPGASFQAIREANEARKASATEVAPTPAGAAPEGGISMVEAVNFTRWLSEQEGVGYRLPELAEVTVLDAAGVLPELAVWTLTPWRPGNDLEFGRMCDRFGVRLYHVWDARRVLGGEVFLGELPEAFYSKLGFVVVTSARTGWLHRWNRINAQL